ncbi:MAG TPA: FliM/FliN family flagellar motor C-terminal domain-containing protein [Candidatus Sulfotelmatobacter sp.]|nr:FliM/FliN family flagellar motor C-terminal domain-containing protein [Candidatus Sulfotelmatobacter sp.]
MPIAVTAKKNEYPEELWEQASLLPCVLSVDVPLKEFTVRDLLRMEPGSIVESRNVNGADVPVFVNARLIGWAEFEVVGQRLAVRLTELI